MVSEFEFGISEQTLVDSVMHCVEIAADLEVVNSGGVPRREVVVVAQLDAPLVEFLRRAVPAEAAAALEVQSDQRRIERSRVPAVLLEAEGRLVEGVAVVPLMPRCSAIDPVLEVGGRLE